MSSPPKGGSNTSTSFQETSKSSKKKDKKSSKQQDTASSEADGHPGPSTSIASPSSKKDNREESSGGISTNSTPVAHNNNNPDREKENKKSRSCFCVTCCCCNCSCLTVHNQVKEKNNKMHQLSSSADNYHNGNESVSQPTVEEVRSWGESFDRLMKCAAGRQIFREFLRLEYSEENILFWQACEDLKREKNPEIVEEKARSIYEDYVSILSPKEVSLDSKVREIVNKNMKQPTTDTFDEAQFQIYTLMHRDSYPRFLCSPMYRRLAQLSPPTPPTRKTSISVG
ncbi:regulator of G-protein signaling 20 isoform X2 [Parasteatoda tepidariorum]|uniref:regulator of G-protein signaling 20 isoform X2 n=1 Tax=Parasteatoda tepidariorum TaxID=114398 RepID=UPI00077F96FE|nr:regulator of G-protein signaling 20 isoform X2 [Parasteatoda tepidariorum]